MSDTSNRPSFEDALANFLRLLNEANVAYFAEHYPRQTPPVFKVDGSGTRQLRIISARQDGTSRSAYCFVECGTGKIMKPGGWKTPEPKRYERGNIFRENPIEGCGPYGVEYRRGGGNFKF